MAELEIKTTNNIGDNMEEAITVTDEKNTIIEKTVSTKNECNEEETPFRKMLKKVFANFCNSEIDQFKIDCSDAKSFLNSRNK